MLRLVPRKTKQALPRIAQFWANLKHPLCGEESVHEDRADREGDPLDARHVAELQAIIADVERCVLPKPGESFDDYRQRVEARS